MSQEGYAPTNKSSKTKEDKIIKDSTVQNVDNDTVCNYVCSPVVDLTDDAWLVVFSYLHPADRTIIAGVCRRWRQLALISWKSITSLSFKYMFKPSLEGHQLTDGLLEDFVRKCGTCLRCLDLSSAPDNLTPAVLDVVGLHCTSLQELNLSEVDFNERDLKTLAEKLPRLRSLKLNNCVIKEKEGLRWALNTLQSLKLLSIADNDWITGEFFSQAPKSLAEVFAMNCYDLTDTGVGFLADRCPNLETIDISKCNAITGQSIRALAKNCRKLKRFRFKKWHDKNVSTSDFLTLSNLPLLEELHVDGHTDAVTDEVFKKLGRHCPLLRSVSCMECCKLTDVAISQLFSCLNLEIINLSRCDHITDKGLIQLSSAHPLLKKVYLRGCWKITDEGVGHLLSNHPNLLVLDTIDCRGVIFSVS